jgi:hypothetical protein
MYLGFNFPYLPCPPPFKSKFLDLESERELGAFKTKKDNGVVTQLVTKEATQGSGRAAIPEPLASGEFDSTSTAFFHTTHNLLHHKTKLLLQRQTINLHQNNPLRIELAGLPASHYLQGKFFKLVNFHTLPTHTTQTFRLQQR